MYWLFLSVLLYSINNILWKLFVRDEIPLQIISRRAIFTTSIAIAALIFTHVDVVAFIHHPKLFYVILASLFGTAGLVLMVTFLKEGSLVRMGYYSLLGSFIAAGYTYLFREALISPKTILGTILIIIGYLVFLLNEKRSIKTEPALLIQHLILGGMTLCFSLSLLIQWESLKIFPPLAIISTQECTVLVVTFIASLFLKPTKPLSTSKIKIISKTALMALVIFAGIFVGTIGLKQVNPFIASITGISVPVITVFAASIVFHDKLKPLHFISLLLMIIGGLALL